MISRPAPRLHALFAAILLVALLVVPTTAATVNESVDGDKHIITIYDEMPLMGRVFDQPGDGWSDIYIEREQKNRIDRMVIHRDIGDLDHIIFASDQIVTTGYDWVDEVPITVYWDPTYVDSGFPSEFNGTYVGSGTMYAYSNSITQEGHLTLIFDDWDSSIYQQHQDTRIFCWIDAARPLNFSTIRMGDLDGAVTNQKPINDDVVCSIYGLSLTSGKRGFRYGTSTHVYTTGGVFEHEIHYSYLTPEILDVEIHRSVAGTQYGSVIKIFSSNQTEPYFIDNTATSVVRTHLPPSEAPFVVEIYSPSTDKTYTTTIYGDSPTPTDPGDPSRVMVHIIAQDARNENLLLDAAVEVRDQYDAVVAAGTTSPEGWMVFEYDLPDTLTDEDFDRYYTVSVSLPGWTQKVTNFKFYPAFIPRSGDWIRVEMLPDTDGPADPEKTYIMFFVRDIHANPLERASIEIAGQYWHTNSAGHVAVEVPKNSTTAYTVRKTGHVSISGSAAVGAEGSYVVNIALGPALPDRTPGPGDDPGATPPPRDTRTNEEKGKAVIDLIADNAELIATLAILAAVMGLINLIMPGRRRR